MINLVNDLIEVNLQLLYKAENNFLNLKDFRDQAGKPFQEPKAFVRLLRLKKLVINSNDDIYGFQLTEFGKEIYENGGWLKHLRNEKESNKVKMQSKNIKKKSLLDFFITNSKF